MAVALLSLVVPAYKQEKTIVQDINNLDKALSSFTKDYEIIVVVDGYVDKTLQRLKKIKNTKVKVFGYKTNAGKGFAIKYGVKKAKGDIVGFIDAGMDLDPGEISLMLGIMEWNKADIVIGSKLHPDSIVNYPISRRIISWGARVIIRTLFKLKVKDTQVGLKLFSRKVIEDVFPRIVVKKFAFDIEVLAVSVLFGYDKIYEAPIKLKFKQGSINSTNFWKILFWTLLDAFAIFYRMNILRYYNKTKS